jgi:hypothetical protein
VSAIPKIVPIPLLLCSHTSRDHFKSSHRLPQCEKCYRILEDVTQLTEHRRSGTCAQKGIELKEGIDDGQWEMIEEVLGKRGKSPSEKERHDIEKWFEIWAILFPGTPSPELPCKLLGLKYFLNVF